MLRSSVRHLAARGWLVRAVVLSLALGATSPATASPAGLDDEAHGHIAGRGGSSAVPDVWIKLCGLSNGCVIDPPPHPWRGKDVYNETGHNQTVAVDIDEGEGVRFWVAVENDGSESDTLGVRGCRGTRTFELNAVVLGKWTDVSAAATNVTTQYKQGTLSFDLDPGSKAFITINIVTHTVKGATYRCLTTVSSANDPASRDTVVGEMTTY